ncbi:MAG: hypothetical protein JOZ48_20665 [Acidobacteriaceae bacterium]|nr:hypothetical protein [Streptosporangiaceae bacterium]MBV9767266.1 hypothetical protein [Acidobacteriaceae bacterium]
MLGTSGISVTPRAVQQRQVGLRFTEPDFIRLEKAAKSRNLGKSTLAQLLILEWLDSLDSGDGE